MEGHGAAGPALVLALERSGLGEAMRQSIWLYPAANVLHVLAMGVLLGSILAFDLRLLGLGRAIPARALARLALPLAAGGLAVALPTGFVLLAADASAVWGNPMFKAKLALLALGLANAAALHRGAMRRIAEWGDGAAPAGARIGAAVSLAAWAGAAASGRLIAYF
jgi:hypothetical protein